MNEQPPPTLMTIDLPTFLRCLREAFQPRPPFAHSRVYADRQLIQRAGVYHGGLLKGDGVGSAFADIYDGLDTNGELIDSFNVWDSIADCHIYEKGLALRVGLYVDLGANVSVFTAYYDPVPREKG
jgi:hypothetical protein